MEINKKKKLQIIIAVFVIIILVIIVSLNKDENIKYSTNDEVNIKQASMIFIENFVNEGIEVYNTGGLDALVGGDYNAHIKGKGGTYLYILDEELNYSIFNPAFPEIVGAVTQKESVQIVRNIIYAGADADGEWIKYFFMDPFDGKRKNKEAYVKKIENGLIFGAGLYLEN